MFTKDVAEKLGYYVYRLVDPRDGMTFYVGKGQGNRVFAHVNEALGKRYEDGEQYDIEDGEDEASAKIQQIRDIKRAGLKVIHVIHRWGLTEEEAYEVEAAVIDCCDGLTNLQAGHGAERGAVNAVELQNTLSRGQFVDRNDIKYCVIKIRRSTLDAHNGNLYEAVRGSWVASLDRMQNVPYVLAAVNGVVRGVFRADRWYDDPTDNSRRMFDGVEAEANIRDYFMDRLLPDHYMQKGATNPVQYSDQ